MRIAIAILLGTLSASLLLAAQTAETRVETLKRAAALIQQNDPAAAETALEPLLRQSPDDAIALNLLGLVRVKQNDRRAAEMLFQKAIQAGHKLPGPRVNLALLYGLDEPEKALDELRQALALAPDDEQAQAAVRQIAKGSALTAMRAGNKTKAAALLASATTLLPSDPDLLYESGLVAYESRHYEEAEHSLKEALHVRPNFPDARYALARTYLAESLGKPAEDQMRRYLTEKPDDATAEYGLGYILMAEQRPDEAKLAFERSLQLQPKQTESLFQLGEIALEQGNREIARTDFEKVLARDPRHGGALTELGVIAFQAAKYDDAKAGLERAIASAPDYQKAHYYYALTLSRLGQKIDAEREFALAKSLQKQHGGAHQLAAQP